MPLGIIDVNEEGHVVGTVLLVEQGEEHTAGHFKHTADGRILLVPQPSDDPNEPLNWPTWKKDMVFLVIFINNIIFGAVPAPLLAASVFEVAAYFEASLTKTTHLTGYMLLVAAVLGPIVSALAGKFGKRPQFVFASTMGMIGTAICCASGKSYNTFLAGRLVQAFGTTAFESLSLAAVGDLYFVHERGTRAGFMVLTLLCMPGVVSVVSGPITQTLGWRYMFIIYLPFTIAACLSTLFLVPETQYVSGIPEQATVEEAAAIESKAGGQEHVESVAAGSSPSEESHTYVKKSYWQTLSLWNGVYPGSFFKLLVAPFVILLNPAVTWSLLTSAVPISLFGSMSFILAQIFSGPPYLLNAAQNGYFYAGAITGGLLAGLLGGLLCDAISKALVKRNRGVFEAEFRIPVQIFGALFCGLGFFIFMWEVDHPTAHGYYIASVCHGLTAAGVTLTATSSSLYVIDAHRNQATEIFILGMSTKNILFYGISLFVNDWVAKAGAGELFKVWGIVALCVLSLNIPMYVFGKMNRKFIMKLGFMHRFTGLYDQ